MRDELETLRARCARLRAALAGVMCPSDPAHADDLALLNILIERVRADTVYYSDTGRGQIIAALEVLRETAGGGEGMKTMTVYEVQVVYSNVLRTRWQSADGVYRDCVDGVAYVATDTPISLARFLGESWRNARRMGQVLVVHGDKEVPHAD